MTELPDALRTTVEHLAAPPEAQRQYLSQLGTPDSADELALEFDDSYVPVRSQLPERVIAHLDALNRLLQQFSGPDHSDKWSAAALSEESAWAEVRLSAQRVLDDVEVQT